MSLPRLVALTMLASSFLLVTGVAAPAFACSCAYEETSDFVASADEIFTGTLVGRVDPTRSGVVSSSDPITYTVEVDGVYRGDVGSVATFESAMSGASCGLEGMEVDERYLVFASIDGSRRTASSCGGTARATPRLVRAVDRLVGAPATPTVGTDPDATAPATSAPARAGDPDRGASWLLPTGVAAVLSVAVIIAGALTWRRRVAPGGSAPRR